MDIFRRWTVVTTVLTNTVFHDNTAYLLIFLISGKSIPRGIGINTKQYETRLKLLERSNDAPLHHLDTIDQIAEQRALENSSELIGEQNTVR
jgi:hypothetical protein